MKNNNSLSILTHYSLVRRGRKDAKKGSVSFIGDNKALLICPFFSEEISLCLNSIHHEKEVYLLDQLQRADKKNDLEKQKRDLSFTKSTLRSEINNLQQETKSLRNKQYTVNVELSKTIRPDDSELIPVDKSVDEKCAIMDAQASLEVEKYMDNRTIVKNEQLISEAEEKIKRIDKRFDEISRVEFEQNEINKLQLDIMVERCKQLYSYSMARIAAYWSGVLRIHKSIDVLGQYDSMPIFKKLKNELKELDSIKEGEEP